ncbi:Fic/DOC family protein [Nitratireductor alexandrii]|uniref:Fic/DOC family protein n=1 Tax=Nitratireductor alexandrii TaxID=2448161 RepID=UPI000FD944BA|nr:Fic family protein [Nitratireductor alexandrii]
MSEPDTRYCYPPDYTVLKNRLNLRDAAELDHFEREFVMQRIAEGVPSGDFDLAHLKAIHRYLFQDVYEWAGELRMVEISKDGHQFQFRRYIETGMADIHRRLIAKEFLGGLDASGFAREAGTIMGDINYVHPFREGNGRTQLLYLEQLAERAGHAIDLTRIQRNTWMTASRQAHLGNYEPTAACIAAALKLPGSAENAT